MMRFLLASIVGLSVGMLVGHFAQAEQGKAPAIAVKFNGQGLPSEVIQLPENVAADLSKIKSPTKRVNSLTAYLKSNPKGVAVQMKNGQLVAVSENADDAAVAEADQESSKASWYFNSYSVYPGPLHFGWGLNNWGWNNWGWNNWFQPRYNWGGFHYNYNYSWYNPGWYNPGWFGFNYGFYW